MNANRKKNQRGPLPGEAALLPASAADSVTSLEGDRWEQFWFAPSPPHGLVIQRAIFAALACWYFVSHWLDFANWYGDGGPLSTPMLGQLVSLAEVEAMTRWYWTPLYWLDSTIAIQTTLAVGGAAAIAMGCGLGGRFTAAVVWVLWLTIANRSWLLAELQDVPMAIGLSGLVIAGHLPGLRQGALGVDTHRPRWNYQLARRWMQIHTSLLACAIAVGQWMNPAWRDGSAVERLLLVHSDSGAVGAMVLGPWLIGNTTALQIVSLGVMALPLTMVPIWWIVRPARGAIAWGLVSHAIAMGLLSGQWLTAVAWAALWLAYLPKLPRQARLG